jgi:methionine sulfoxide reductase heme-binding subunit
MLEKILSRSMTAYITWINNLLSPLVSSIQKNRILISRAILALSFVIIGFIWFPEFQKSLGEFAYTLLLIILIAGPLSRVSGIKLLSTPLLFRRELGICMGMLALLHYLTFLIANWQFLQENPPEPALWIISGFWAMIFTALLLITSNNWAVKKMGKWWKRLHRLVYVILLLVVLHIVALRILGRSFNGIELITVLFAPALFVLVK